MQGFYIYNTMSRSKELLEPLDPPLVKFYSCGPTVYDYAHIGNFRAYIFVDLLRRSLKINGYKIEQVMNITDVEDKIIARATDQAVPIGEIT
ncbi:MAG: cysteine--tRNA ligase, partial [Gemmatimonadota bacterium]|nr:cysteine--tRNA ligase [Gemmatimonadota bacterium]